MKWYLSQGASGEPEIVVRERDEEPAGGTSLLHQMAEDYGLQEIAPGMWFQSTFTGVPSGWQPLL